MVVALGVTAREPLEFTDPIPGVIDTVIALLDVHCNVVDCPAWIVCCEAVSVTVGARAFTVTVTERFTVPPGPAAVIVYVVVAAGVTVRTPLGMTAPIPWSIDSVVALLEVHSNVADWPA